MTLPVVLSVPHAGSEVPDCVAPHCILAPEEIVRDGDEGSAQVYDLADRVHALLTTKVARAIVDLNRSPLDRTKDGVVKTHTCWDVPVYREPLPEDLIERLLAEHYQPYHERLTALAETSREGEVRFGVDCHTMAAVAPPVAPDPGQPRPLVCLGDGAGAFPAAWAEMLRDCFAKRFPGEVTLNKPFRGGYITRAHGREMPWVQLELSRADTISLDEKREAVCGALADFVARVFG